MKISTNQYFRSMGQSISEQQNLIAQTQIKLAKGDTIATPSEDARISTRSLDLRSIISRNEGFLDNLSTLDGRLSNEESIVVAMRDLMTRIKELSVRAASGTYNAADRQTLAVEMQGYRDEILSLSNSTDPSGAYLFSGLRVGTQPFVADETGRIVYQGDQTPTNVAVDTGQKMRLNATEDDLFPVIVRESPSQKVRLFDAMDDLIAAVQSGSEAHIQRGLSESDQIANGLDNYIVDIGVRRKIIESKVDITTDRKLALTKLYSEIRELDYGEAVTELSAQMLALEAAQSSIAKVSQLSLFNYIK
jgi:flagellar hook-associated protein 3 FlgL